MFDDYTISIWTKISWKIEKIWDFFRYNIPNFIKNIFGFRKELWNWRSWDYSYSLEIFAKSLKELGKTLDNGMEIDETRIPKVKNINRAVELLQYHINDEFLELAEKQLNKKFNVDYSTEKLPPPEDEYSELIDNTSERQTKINNEIINLSSKIEEETWNELFDILKGSDNNTGIKSWWD